MGCATRGCARGRRAFATLRPARLRPSQPQTSQAGACRCGAQSCGVWGTRACATPRLRPSQPQMRLVVYCRTTSTSTAPCTSRRMCCPTHCARYCAPCQPLLRANRRPLRQVWCAVQRQPCGSNAAALRQAPSMQVSERVHVCAERLLFYCQPTSASTAHAFIILLLALPRVCMQCTREDGVYNGRGAMTDWWCRHHPE